MVEGKVMGGREVWEKVAGEKVVVVCRKGRTMVRNGSSLTGVEECWNIWDGSRGCRWCIGRSRICLVSWSKQGKAGGGGRGWDGCRRRVKEGMG